MLTPTLFVLAGLVLLGLCLELALKVSAKKDAARQRMLTEELAQRPSTEDILEHTPGLIRECLLENGIPEEEIAGTIGGVDAFLRSIYLLQGKDPWGRHKAQDIEATIGAVGDREDRARMWHAFCVLLFETQYMCHDPEDDTYFLSDELAEAISRRKEQSSLSLQMLPHTPDTAPRYSC